MGSHDVPFHLHWTTVGLWARGQNVPTADDYPANSWCAVYSMCDEGEVVTGGGHEVAAFGNTWVMN